MTIQRAFIGRTGVLKTLPWEHRDYGRSEVSSLRKSRRDRWGGASWNKRDAKWSRAHDHNVREEGTSDERAKAFVGMTSTPQACWSWLIRSRAEREPRQKGAWGVMAGGRCRQWLQTSISRAQDFFQENVKDRLAGGGFRGRREVLWGKERLGHVYQQMTKSQETKRG